MHATEACLAAFEATRDERSLDRVTLLADHLVQRKTAQTDGLLIWEHYRADRSIGCDYNHHDSSDIFRPWGYQPGHFTKRAKLLLILERHRPLPLLLRLAEALFERALTRVWDAEYGGVFYTFGPDFAVCDDRKCHWVQAETLACAALLGARTGSAVHRD